MSHIEADNKHQGLVLVKSGRRDPRELDYALYVLVKDSSGNRRRGAQAPISAFARGEGMTLAEVFPGAAVTTGNVPPETRR